MNRLYVPDSSWASSQGGGWNGMQMGPHLAWPCLCPASLTASVLSGSGFCFGYLIGS